MERQPTGGFKPPRFLGHPLHPMLTDFPLALWSMSLLGDLAGVAMGDEFFHRCAFWLVVSGLVMAVPAIATGLLEFAGIADDHPALKPATWHMWIMLCATTLFGCSLVFRVGKIASSTGALWAAIGCSALGVALLIVGGWFGGELVFRHGIGSRAR